MRANANISHFERDTGTFLGCLFSQKEWGCTVSDFHHHHNSIREDDAHLPTPDAHFQIFFADALDEIADGRRKCIQQELFSHDERETKTSGSAAAIEFYEQKIFTLARP